jgi:hypothetical protein
MPLGDRLGREEELARRHRATGYPDRISDE